MLIVGSRSVAPPPGPEVILDDDFTGVTLDTGLWTATTVGANSTVTQNDQLILTGTIGAVCVARVVSTTEIPTTGLVTVEMDWTPGKMYSGATGIPYVAIIPASPTRDGTYKFPYSYPGIRLGVNTNTTSRTALSVGLWNSTMGDVIGNIGGAAVTCNENTQYHLKWEINWDTETTSLWLDTVSKVSGQTFSAYTATGAHYIELAFCNYGAASNPVEKFDNLTITAE